MNEDKNTIIKYVEDEYENIFKNNDETKKPINKDIILTFGMDEDEDFIIGNEKGLNNLIKSCKEALESDESLNQNLDDLSYGVKKVDDTYFNDKIERQSHLISNFLIFVTVSLFIASLVIGFGTIVKWVFT